MNAEKLQNTEKWLIVDDKVADRLRIQRILQGLGPHIDSRCVAGTAEAKRLLAKEEFDGCILDFYLGHRHSCQGLVEFIRANYPKVTVIVVSSLAATDPKVHSTGADAVAPKFSGDTAEYTALLSSLILSAKRASGVALTPGLAADTAETYLSEKTKTAIKTFLRINKGNLCIEASAGMGKSTLAQQLAAKWRKRNSATHCGEPRILSVSNHLQAGVKAIEALLFGENHCQSLQDSEAQRALAISRGFLEQGLDSVLVIDDLHLLPQSLQRKIKAAFDSGYFETALLGKTHVSKFRIIFTYDKRFSESLVPGLLHSACKSKVAIPNIHSQLSELPKIIDELFKSMVRRKSSERLSQHKGFRADLINAVRKNPVAVSMRSLARTLDCATDAALSAKKAVVSKSDFGNFEFLYEDLKSELPSAEPISLKGYELLGNTKVQQLIDAVLHQSYKDASDVLRRIMFEYHLNQSEGNLAKVSRSLKISRGLVYRGSFRALRDCEK